MRLLLLALLLLGACAERLDGKTSAEWTAELIDDQKVGKAQERLAALGSDAVKILIEIERQGPPKAQIQAAALLGRLGPEAAPAVPVLIEALASKEKGVRGMAAIALGRIGVGARDAVVPLDRLLKDRDVRVRVAAALAIYGITGSSVEPTRVLFDAFASPDPDVRAMVAEAFEHLGTPVIPILVASLEGRDEGAKIEAARTLGAMGPLAEEARGALRKALDDPSEAVRAAASEALVRLGQR